MIWICWKGWPIVWRVQCTFSWLYAECCTNGRLALTKRSACDCLQWKSRSHLVGLIFEILFVIFTQRGWLRLLLYSCTPGTLDWMYELKWNGLSKWNLAPRRTQMTNNTVTAFVKSYQNLEFWQILGAGHMVLITPHTHTHS